MCESMGKQVPPIVRMQGSIITVVGPSKCQTSIRKIKALDVQMLIDAPPFEAHCSSALQMAWTPVQQFPVTV